MELRTVKATVKVADLMSNPNNPRRDFGDIHELAERIRITGGQPIQPLVVVRKGSRYMIVDGDRRYHAMLELGTEECECLVCSDWSEAAQAVAMLATDDKKQLTDVERGRGMQLMLSYDVDDEQAAAALGIGADKARRVRGIKGELDGKQLTLDLMLDLAEADLTEEERAKVIGCADAGKHDEARALMNRFGRAHREDALIESVFSVLGESVVRVHGQLPPRSELRDGGWKWFATIGSAEKAESVAQEISRNPGVYRAWRDNSWVEVFVYAPSSGETPEEEEARKKREREVDVHKAAYSAMLESMAEYVAGRDTARFWPHDAVALITGGVRTIGYKSYMGEVKAALTAAGMLPTDTENYLISQPSSWEAMAFVGTLAQAYMPYGLYMAKDSDSGMDRHKAACIIPVFDALASDGWQPEPAWAEIRQQAGKLVEGSGR